MSVSFFVTVRQIGELQFRSFSWRLNVIEITIWWFATFKFSLKHLARIRLMKILVQKNDHKRNHFRRIIINLERHWRCRLYVKAGVLQWHHAYVLLLRQISATLPTITYDFVAKNNTIDRPHCMKVVIKVTFNPKL